MYTIDKGIVLKGDNLHPVHENIVVEDGVIVEIAKDVLKGEIIDAEGSIICPTFLNAHTHIGDGIIKDEGYGLTIDEMVKPPNGVKHKALSKASDNDIIDSMKESMWDMVLSGTSHFIDYRECGVEGVKLLKKAAEDIPITPIILGRDDSFYGEDPDLHKVKIAINKLLKVADGIAPSGFGEITDEVAHLIVEECSKKSKIASIHAAESKEAQLNSIEKTGRTEIKRALDSNFNQVVHCTNPMDYDLELLSKSNVNVVLCPRANATLGVGISPLNEIINLGIKPLIGSDNIMLNSPNMLREMEFSLKLMAICSDTILNPKDLLKCATVNVCSSGINEVIKKPVIAENNPAQFFMVEQFSKNPYLSIINRTETKHIIYPFNINTL